MEMEIEEDSGLYQVSLEVARKYLAETLEMEKLVPLFHPCQLMVGLESI